MEFIDLSSFNAAIVKGLEIIFDIGEVICAKTDIGLFLSRKIKTKKEMVRKCNPVCGLGIISSSRISPSSHGIIQLHCCLFRHQKVIYLTILPLKEEGVRGQHHYIWRKTIVCIWVMNTAQR